MRLTIELDDEQLAVLAERVADLLAERQTAESEPWLTVEQAAAHLALSTSQLYTLTSQRARNGIPVTKEGSRSYFRASELDDWRRGTHNGHEPSGRLAKTRIARL